jgi:hypothetical protein
MEAKDFYVVRDSVYEMEQGVDSEIGFNIHDGYYPLARIKTLYDTAPNPYFRTACRTQYGGSRITDKVYYNLHGPGTSMKYKKTTRYAGARYVNFYFGFFSAIGITQLDYLPTTMLGPTQHMMFGEPDVFCVAVIKTGAPIDIKMTYQNKHIRAHRRYAYHTNSYEIKVRYKDIIILVSEDKLRKAAFAKTYYTTTVRKAILGNLLRQQRTHGIAFEDVPDSYLKNFVRSSKSIRTNSLVETLTIGRDIKENVFSNLNKLVV